MADLKLAEQKAREYFDSLSKSEFIEILEMVGFQVIPGNGEVIYTENETDE